MKVFLSWSGPRSRQLAEVLNQWLPAALHAVKTYYSPEDTLKGTRWEGEIAKELEACSVGILCMTHDNLHAPWLLFEAGALSKRIGEARVVPLLFGGLKTTDLEYPLAALNAATFDRDDMRRVINMINASVGDDALEEPVLQKVFEKWWPDLDEQVRLITAAAVPEKHQRTTRELLEEILSHVRTQSRPRPRFTYTHASLDQGATPVLHLKLDQGRLLSDSEFFAHVLDTDSETIVRKFKRMGANQWLVYFEPGTDIVDLSRCELNLVRSMQQTGREVLLHEFIQPGDATSETPGPTTQKE